VQPSRVSEGTHHEKLICGIADAELDGAPVAHTDIGRMHPFDLVRIQQVSRRPISDTNTPNGGRRTDV